MRVLRLLAAFGAGVLLYQVAVVLVGGILAAVQVPQAYFAWFGRSRQEIALALLDVFGFALPIALLVAGGTLAAQRLLGQESRLVLLFLLGGLVTCFAFWLWFWVFSIPANSLSETFPHSVLFRQVMLPQWWAATGTLAPWLGYALAAWLILRNPRLSDRADR